MLRLRLPFLLALPLLLSSAASALTFDLVSEFDGDLADAAYASVEVSQNGDDLDFVVTLGGLLGSGEDLHELYFNLVGSFTGVDIIADDSPSTPYSVDPGPSVAGGAGSSFDFGVSFGDGGGPPGNGVLAQASFTLSADQPLALADLLESSFTSQGIEAQMAVHIQGTSTPNGSETVGGVVPEPATALLLLVGLVALRRR